MSSPIPIMIDGTDALAAAIRLRAAREGVSEDELVRGLLRKALAPEVEEASGALPLAAVIQQVVQAGPKCA